MAQVSNESDADRLGLHSEQLGGRDQTRFLAADEEENFVYPWAFEVDFDKETEFDAAPLTSQEVNVRIRELMEDGYGTITVRNPGAKHSIGVGILNRLNLKFDGSLGYYGCGLIDGPNVHVNGRVGWSCGENMLAGTVVIEKNGGTCHGSAMRGGDLVCKGQVGARTGICMKGGTIIVGGDTGAYSGFMMQRGRMVVLGDAGKNLGDTMYDGTIYVGGSVTGLGVDAVDEEMNDLDVKWLSHKLGMYGLEAPNGIENMRKIVAGKQLWNYDNLESTEKKLVL